MAYEVEETGQLSRTATVTVGADEFAKKVNKALREVGKNVKIRGFRKGQIPIDVLKKRYGGSVQQDVIEDLVRSKINEIISSGEQAIMHIGQPQVTVAPQQSDEGFEFTFDFELRPEVDPIGYLGLEVDMPTVEVEREAVDAQLEQMRQEYATLEPIAFRQTIAEGDIVTFNYEAVGEGEALEQMTGDNAQIEIGSGNALPGLEDALLGAGFDATVTAEVTPDEHFPVEELRGQTIELKLEVTSVKQRKLPELDDEFAKDTGEAETMLELRAKIKEELAHQREHEAEHYAEDDLIEKLLAQNEFELPPKFLDEQVQREVQRRQQMFQQLAGQGMDLAALGIDVDNIADEVRDDVADQVRTEILLLAIAGKESLDLEQEDLMRHIEHRAQHQGVSPQQFMQRIGQDPQFAQQLQLGALLEKTRRFLLDKADKNEVPWPEPEPDLPGAEAEETEEKAEKPKKKAKAKKEEKEAEAEKKTAEKKSTAKKSTKKKKADESDEDEEK